MRRTPREVRVPHFICARCGVQYAESDRPPARCAVCEDERQYLGPEGQQWTTLDAVGEDRRNRFQILEPGITAIGSEPFFAIGQRAMLIQTPEGNLLWDCITLVDEETVTTIERMGGIAAIAVSHPHFYSTMVEWSRRFGGVPIYLHEDDREGVMRSDPAIIFWRGEELPLLAGATVIRCGGHFPGAAGLHWALGADGRGTLHTGDTISVVADRRRVSFMYSYPNLIPLPPYAVRRIVNALRPYTFDRIYSAFWGGEVESGARLALMQSARRYIDKLEG